MKELESLSVNEEIGRKFLSELNSLKDLSLQTVKKKAVWLYADKKMKITLLLLLLLPHFEYLLKMSGIVTNWYEIL